MLSFFYVMFRKSVEMQECNEMLKLLLSFLKFWLVVYVFVSACVYMV